MKTIWKFVFEKTEMPVLLMPSGATILTVAVQHENWCLWAEVDTEAKNVARYFHIAGTGQALIDEPDGRREHIGMFQVKGGDYIFHVFALYPDGAPT